MGTSQKPALTAAKRAKILTGLQAGQTLQRAAQAARTTLVALQGWMAEDDEWAEQVEEAMALGQAARVREREVAAAAPAETPAARVAAPEPQPDDPAPTEAPPPSERRAVEPLASSPEDEEATAWQARWGEARAEAARLGPGCMGQLAWVEQRCVRAGLHPMDRQWTWHFSEFYASEKRVDLGRFGLRGAKSDSNCRAITAEVLFTPRRLEPGIVGVCPVIAQNMREADDRFDTIVAILRACGIKDLTGTRSNETDGFNRSGGGSNARVIALRDADGHPVEFRVYPASVSGAAGFTAIAGFCDEVDLWGKDLAANPAKRVLEVLFTRFTTQPGSRLHIMSASYQADSAHATMVAQGDTPLQRVARLGDEGARIDTEARARLAVAIGSSDPLLVVPSKPDSTDIPCWVSNPVAPIDVCFALSEGKIKRMMALYGGRASESGGRAVSVSVEEMRALAEANRRLMGAAGASVRGDLQRFDGLPSWDPRSRTHHGDDGGGQSL